MSKFKKLIISIILITILLSTLAFFGKNVLAVVTPEMESGNGNTDVVTSAEYTLEDLYSQFDIFCSQHKRWAYIDGNNKIEGTLYTATAGYGERYYLGTHNWGEIPGLLGFHTYPSTIPAQEAAIIAANNKVKPPPLDSPIIVKTLHSPKYVLNTDPSEEGRGDETEATPEEAYVLAEMSQNVSYGVRTLNIYNREEALLNPVTIDPDDITSDLKITNAEGGTEEWLYLIEHKNDDGVIDNIEYFIKEGSQFYKVTINSTINATAEYGVLSYVQQAWWQTPAGSHGAPTSGNALSEEAKAFEKYILKAARKSSVPELQYEYIAEHGVKAPILQYEPEWNEDSNKDGTETETDKVIVAWDADNQTYKVGPFSMEYIDARITTNEGTPSEYTAIFAHISESVLTTNKGDLKRVDDQYAQINPGEYRFIFKNPLTRPTKEKDGNTKFPMPNEVFYLEIGYMEGLTEIQNLEFEFEFMNAGGRFQDLKGTAVYQEWVFEEKTSKYGLCLDPDCTKWHSFYYGTRYHSIETELYITCNYCKPNYEIQRMAHGSKGARWYNYTTLSLMQYLPDYGSLVIEKQVVDESGNPVEVTEDTNFEFDVTIQKQDLDGNSITDKRTAVVTVKKGQSSAKQIVATEQWGKFSKKQYSHKEEDIVEVAIPTYTIKEKEKDGYQCDPNTYTGQFKSNLAGEADVTIAVKNTQEKKKGSLQINKVISEDLAVETDSVSLEEVAKKYLEEKVYYFNIYINEELKYKKVEISKATDWKYVMPEESWPGESPIYKVEEVNEKGEVISEVDNIEVKYNAQTGKLEDGETVVVTATNTAIRHKGTLKISKILKNTVSTEINDTEFKFKVKVEGYEEKEITVKSGSVWSQEYYWVGDTAPKYTITEIIEDENRYKLANITDSLGVTGNLDEKTITGSLEKDKEVTVTAENTDKMLQGKLQITKKILDRNGNALISDKNQEFNFDVTVKYKKNDAGSSVDVIDEKQIKLVVEAGKSIATSEELFYEWDGELNPDNPEYTIEEAVTDDYKVDNFVTNDTDAVKDTANRTISGRIDPITESIPKIEVEVNNKEKELETGKIKIKKQILGEPVTTDTTFEFTINVKTGEKLQKETGIKVTVPAGLNEGVSKEYEFSWVGGEAAEYEVIEVIPELSNYKLVSITPQKGNLTNASTVEVTAINARKTTEEQGKIRITKQLIDRNDKKIVAEKDTVFSFDVDVAGYATQHVSVVVKKGESQATSEELTYTWKKEDYPLGVGPWYEIKEVNVNGEYIQKSITPSEGNLTKNTVINVVATNKKIGDLEGKLLLTKNLVYDDGTTAATLKEDTNFEFEIKVTEKKEDGTVVKEEINIVNVPVKAGESVGTAEFKYTWKENIKAFYEVTEVTKDGFKIKNIEKASGEMKEMTADPNTIIKVNATNKVEKLKGRFQIFKKVDHEDLMDKEFKVKILIEKEEEEIVSGKGTGNFIKKTETREQTIKVDNSYTSENIVWNSNEAIPKITITEIQLPDNSKLQGYINNGVELIPTLNDNPDTAIVNTVITAVNTINQRKGQIQIAKDLAGGVNGIEFKFRVQVDGYAEKIVVVKSGETWRSDYYYWTTEENPKYTVTELDSDSYNYINISATDGTTSGKTVSGELKDSTVINIKAENKAIAKNGKIKITKELRTDDKTDVSDVKDKFEFAITIFYDDPTKLFTYNGKEYNSLTISEVIKGGGSVTTSNITWYDNEAPKYSVKEVSIPNNWRFLKFDGSPAGTLTSGTINVKCINEQIIDRKYYFTMEMGGKVWNDTVFKNGKPVDTECNGLIDDHEEGFADIKVTIYKVIKNKISGEIVKRYVAGEITDIYGNVSSEAILYTDANGIWRVKEMLVPGLTEAERITYPKEIYVGGYDIEFEYDAQTYEPTKFLATSGGIASTYINATTTVRDTYLKNSMVKDDDSEREDFNKRFEVISGGNPIDGNGNTKGNASAGEINYSSKDVQGIGGLNTKKVSTVNLYKDKDSNEIENNDQSNLYDIYKLSSRTSTGGLVYPFDSQTVLQSTDTNIDYGVKTVNYHYKAAYPYLNSINFGLIERKHADIAIEKDLEEAIVVVNKKAYKYTYDELANREFAKYPDLLYKQIETNDMDVKYRLNVYSTDYYYKAAIYDKAEVEKPDGTKANLYALLDEYYKSLSLNGVVDTELDIYVKYKTTIINESDSYNVIVNQISDYYDSEMELVTTEVKKYIEENNGHVVEDTTLIAKPSYIAGTGDEVKWSESVEVGQDSSTGKKYNKMTTESLKGIELKSGETQTIYTTFRIKKNQPAEITETGEIILGTKHNIVEIDSYSTYYSKNADTIPPEERIAGRIEEDSAPGNINLKEYNEPTWYEDDTSAAPVLTIDLYDIRREINGLVWEDKESQEIQYHQKVGDGKYNEPEEEDTIPYMTTELYEKVTVPFEEVQDDGTSKTVYYDYDFLWPTDVAIPGLDGTIEELTGFDSTIRTNDLGQYKFEGISSGNYIVRFTYGDEATLQYSGQDYKSTVYQADGPEKVDVDEDGDGIKEKTIEWKHQTNLDANGQIVNEWHDLDNEALVANRVSDARDDEIRRLDVIAKSQTLTYDNTSILARTRDGLEDYYMFADTAKINMNLEKFVKNVTGTYTAGGIKINIQKGIIETTSGTTGSINITYIIDNIDFGIEERSQTNVVLDKQIKEIKLTTSAGDLILDAKFDISYEYTTDGYDFIPNVTLDPTSIGTENLQKLNNTATLQGFRYINVDKDILQGATIQVIYQFTVLNTGEVDRCGEKLVKLRKLVVNGAENADFTNAKQTLKDNNAKWDTCEYGKYLGKVYYSGEHAMDATGKCEDKIVTTTIHKVIDYVDNDVVFSSVDNMGVDSSWANTTTDYLTTGNLIDENILVPKDDGSGDKQILDEYGRAFESAHKNNLIVNVDNDDTAQPQLTNPGFVTKLVPNNAYKVEKSEADAAGKECTFKDTASMTLTVSRYYSSESDTENIDNLSEIIEMYNDVGRRDVGTIQGNAKPSEGPFKTSIKETDSSATELITLSPPTGISSKIIFTIQLLSVILSAVTILVIGIIAIKKKVLTK